MEQSLDDEHELGRGGTGRTSSGAILLSAFATYTCPVIGASYSMPAGTCGPSRCAAEYCILLHNLL
jgi:hypothetical protein